MRRFRTSLPMSLFLALCAVLALPLFSTALGNAVQSGPTSWQLTIPSDPGVVLPGYYMLFALTAAGVPSVSTTVQVLP